jgi:hypothetical protein
MVIGSLMFVARTVPMCWYESESLVADRITHYHRQIALLPPAAVQTVADQPGADSLWRHLPFRHANQRRFGTYRMGR